MAGKAGAKFVDEIAGLLRQGREDLLSAIQRPLPDSMALLPPPVAAERDFDSVLAEYAQRGQGQEQPERGRQESGFER